MFEKGTQFWGEKSEQNSNEKGQKKKGMRKTGKRVFRSKFRVRKRCIIRREDLIFCSLIPRVPISHTGKRRLSSLFPLLDRIKYSLSLERVMCPAGKE